MVIVYTTIFGGSDSLKPAPAGADRCVCFVDDPEVYADALGWELVRHPLAVLRSPRREAWHLRCVPQTLFREYSTVVWIDASFTLTDPPRLLRDAEGHALSGLRHHTRSTCYEEGTAVVLNGQSKPADVSAQLNAYRREGFHPSSLTISCVLLRSNAEKVKAFNELWDAEIQKHPGDNTQLSLDYCAWKGGLTVHHLEGVRKDNPYAVHDHSDHKRRRKPYR